MKKEKIYSIGIDVSKKTLDICFLGKNFKVLKEQKISNNDTGLGKMEKILEEYAMDENMSFIFEATGTYHVFACLYLKEKKYSVKVFNPIISKKYAGASVRKCKTDKIDAKQIAQIGILEEVPEFEITKENFFLKKKISFLQTLSKQKQVLKVSIKQFSEDCDVLGHNEPDILLQAKENLKSLEKTIRDLEKEISKEGKKLKEHKNISDIKGVSKKSTTIVLSYISDKNFSSKQALTAFSGLDVSTKESGTSVHGNGKISKRGNSILRKTLTQIAWGLIMHNENFKKLFDYYKNLGKHYHAILVIIARKFLHIIFGMMKNNSPFNPNKILIPS